MASLLGSEESDIKASVDNDGLLFDQTLTYPEWSMEMSYTPFNVPLSDIIVGFCLVLALIVMFYARSFLLILLTFFLAVFFFSAKRVLAAKYSKCYIRNFLWFHFGFYPCIDPFQCPKQGKLKKVSIEYQLNK